MKKVSKNEFLVSSEDMFLIKKSLKLQRSYLLWHKSFLMNVAGLKFDVYLDQLLSLERLLTLLEQEG